MIKISNLAKKYYDTTIVDGLSLTIKKGTVFGFLGPNGAGKTTTIKMLVGLNQPDKGSVSIAGSDPTAPKSRQKIGFMPENPYFYDHLTGIEMLKFCYDLSDQNSESTPKDLLEHTLEQVGLKEFGNKMIRSYSKGMKQRLGLAQAIVHDPDYIFLDEPLDGLDPIGRIEIKKIIEQLKKRNKTLFFNSHILSDVEELCDEIGIINRGKLLYSGGVKEFCGKLKLEKAFVQAITNGKLPN